jgi:CRP-like cAMP-binding protein
MEERLREVQRTLLLVVEARLQEPRVGAAARRLLGASDRRARAHALEALDALLPRALAARVVSALDDAPLDERVLRAREALRTAAPGASDATDAELTAGDPLSRALLVHAVGQRGRARHRDAIRAAAAAGAREVDPLRVLRRIHSTDEEDDDVPGSVEAMILLRGVPLLAELTPGQLGALAEAARWEHHAAGDTVADGDEALFVVHSGRVRAGDVELGPGAAAGERALFGAGAVHLVALERTRLLRLGREHLERAVEDAPGIALAICRVLARQPP